MLQMNKHNMKGLIILVIYFSGTGNSRYAAESLAKRLNDSLISSNEYIKEGKTADFSSEKPYIFVAPTYSWRMPRIFSDFIRCGKHVGVFRYHLRGRHRKRRAIFAGAL